MNTAFDMRLPSPFSVQDRNRIRRTVFYGRVSTEHEAQMSALENQIQWYDDQARLHKNWDVLGKYIDEGITGTQAKKRPAFLRMLEDARARKFDLIVTREVCRFARNTVDTLVVTRELKNLGIEVYFVDDNIWTMDGDGELRLTIMATLAQEESRKVSERVKAGQHISRTNATIYGNGNILGYDRVDGKYIINKEQAETVRMIYDLYLTDTMGTQKLASEMIRRGRKTATGTDKWTCSIIGRVLSNPTYMGYQAYGKSFNNNYLEQKRINNHNRDTYLYTKADIEPIVTEEEFEKVQEIKARRKREIGISRQTPFGEEMVTAPKRESKEKWCRKLRCSCGSTFRRDRWHKNKGCAWSYGYQCYNQVNNRSARFHKKLGNPHDSYCDVRMVADWKLEYMCQEILKVIWGDNQPILEEACEMIKKYYKAERDCVDKGVELKKQIARLEQKMKNIRDMRADGDLDASDFHERIKKVMDEKAGYEEQLALVNNTPVDDSKDELKWDAIMEALKTAVDFGDKVVDEAIVDAFVYKVVPDVDNKFTWYINLSGEKNEEIYAFLTGRKNKQVLALELKDGTPLKKSKDFFV